MKEEKVFYINALRVFAMFSMIMLHVSASNFYAVDVNSLDWMTFNFFDSLVRHAVPIFFMISGCMLLDNKRELSYGKLYKVKIFRLVSAFSFWSIVYILVLQYFKYTNTNEWYTLKEFVIMFFAGRYHLWFLFTLVGLYIATPILRKITEDMKITKYFLICSFIFCFLTNVILKLDINENIISIITTMKSSANLHIFMGYISYFILGYYLSNKELSKKIVIGIYIIGVLSTIFTMYMTYDYSVTNADGKANVVWYNNLSANVYLSSLSLFVFFKYEVSKLKECRILERVIAVISDYSFGIYLAHDIINILIRETDKITTVSYCAPVAVIVNTMIVFLGSFVIVFIIKKIPLVRKCV